MRRKAPNSRLSSELCYITHGLWIPVYYQSPTSLHRNKPVLQSKSCKPPIAPSATVPVTQTCALHTMLATCASVHRLRGRFVPLTIRSSFRRRLHILPRQSRRTYPHQRHDYNNFVHHSMRRGLSRRSRICRSLHRCTNSSRTSHNVTRHGLPPASYHDIVR